MLEKHYDKEVMKQDFIRLFDTDKKAVLMGALMEGVKNKLKQNMSEDDIRLLSLEMRGLQSLDTLLTSWINESIKVGN